MRTIPEQNPKYKNLFLRTYSCLFSPGRGDGTHFYEKSQWSYGKENRAFTSCAYKSLSRFRDLPEWLLPPKKKRAAAPIIASGKLSDYHLRLIIKAYAYDVPAAHAAKSMSVSYVSVRNIYALIRRRMIELGLYQSRERYEAFMEEGERDDGPYWDRSNYDRYVKRGLSLRRGVTPATKHEHIAELIFRFAKPAHLTAEQHNARHHADIVQLIKLSGPLNRPLTEDARDRAFWYRGERTLSLAMEGLGRILNLADRDFSRGRSKPDPRPPWPIRKKYRR
ncbi:hypothetical protein PSQ19_17445 [Devosia algicola]|uniref:Uncharacterized protein n=1 Tax=Devosia algicola TaxID=3026418 RepID=A0ABY7YM41_9HYPH|nr:hypothetical protein [Devosia algicola]WDR02375.1 hypothetical protein PSQ19_17445 [Devosia algicola]